MLAMYLNDHTIQELFFLPFSFLFLKKQYFTSASRILFVSAGSPRGLQSAPVWTNVLFKMDFHILTCSKFLAGVAGKVRTLAPLFSYGLLSQTSSQHGSFGGS
jgi:hypothetical protein